MYSIRKPLILMVSILMAVLLNAQKPTQNVDWPLYAYNFGGLQEMSPAEQVSTLVSAGYQGVSVMANHRGEMIDLKPFFRAASSHEDFKVFSVFFRYNANDVVDVREGWKSVIDQLSGKNTALWVIFGRPNEKLTKDFAVNKLIEINNYAKLKGVEVILYPHHKDVIQTAEEAFKIVDSIDSDNLNLVYHTCHEIRSGQGLRAPEVLRKIKDRLKFVTIAGSDKRVDTTNAMSIENSTIKPLYRGNYDLMAVLKGLKDIRYQGAVGFINHQIKEDPEVYLPESNKTYRKWLNELNKLKWPKGYDAPDQAVYHKGTDSWYISNLGGGISLEQDSYGWITRTDARGVVKDTVWIGIKEGMHAPSGMIIKENLLFVCDRTGVHEIDILKKTIVNFYPLPGGKFINDIAIANNGDLFISDFFGNKIYKLPAKSRKAEVWLETERLEAPDGLLMDGENLIVASWGKLSEPGSFETTKLGDLLSIDLKTKKITPLIKEVGNMEGITKAGDYYYITDWAAGELLKVNPKSSSVEKILTGLKHPTDPMYAEDLGILGFPQHGTNQVLFMKLKK
ncbi:TIM barrel protein [Galbibacter sp. BG1]|uniref:TIM barrel protein n=1 Tax=Galbibacter sp. BG1 TaxID=1170699 RepID=UPI0015BCA089|nr:TIM barrel protein [Galbibacter sp. BG1]QLE02458.1 TIM barrel protein [Galbibacter sp. BG1]